MSPRLYKQLKRGTNTKDSSGNVQVRIVLANGKGSSTSGNITRCFTVKSAKVSAVARAIRKALFGNHHE